MLFELNQKLETALRERDSRIAALEKELAELNASRRRRRAERDGTFAQSQASGLNRSAMGN